jgi:hypothetical protein
MVRNPLGSVGSKLAIGGISLSYGAEQSSKPLVREARKTWVEELTSWAVPSNPTSGLTILLVMSSVAHTNEPGGPLVEAGGEDLRRDGMLGAPALHPQSQ